MIEEDDVMYSTNHETKHLCSSLSLATNLHKKQTSVAALTPAVEEGAVGEGACFSADGEDMLKWHAALQGGGDGIPCESLRWWRPQIFANFSSMPWRSLIF